MKKNFLSKLLGMAVVMVLTSALTVAGTLAYLTDRDSKQNVFSTGDIDIALNEEVGVVGTGATVTETETGHSYDGVMPGDKLVKEVTVENTGSNDAYVRVIVTVNNAGKINNAIDEFYEAKGYSAEEIQAIYDYVFDGWGLNYTKTDADGNATGMRLTITGEDMPEGVSHVDSVKTIDEYAQFYKGNWFGEQSDIIPFDGYYTKDMDTYTIRYVYYMFLEEGDSVTLFNGLNAPREFVREQLAMFEGLTIDVVAEAIQADNIPGYGLEDVTVGLKNAMRLLDGEDINLVETADDLIETLVANGEDVVLGADIKIEPASMSNAYGKTGITVTKGQTIDGAGHTLDIKGAGGTWDSGICTTGGLIKNITVTGSFRGIFIKSGNNAQKVVLENVICDGTTYTISCDQASKQGLEATNSTFNGWTSYAATIGDVKFVNCSFGAGNGYNFSRPYAPTEYVNCEFAEGHKVDPRAAVTFENCTLNGVALTAENIHELVTKTTNVTVK